jgi:hypothetical protein
MQRLAATEPPRASSMSDASNRSSKTAPDLLDYSLSGGQAELSLARAMRATPGCIGYRSKLPKLTFDPNPSIPLAASAIPKLSN